MRHTFRQLFPSRTGIANCSYHSASASHPAAQHTHACTRLQARKTHTHTPTHVHARRVCFWVIWLPLQSLLQRGSGSHRGASFWVAIQMLMHLKQHWQAVKKRECKQQKKCLKEKQKKGEKKLLSEWLQLILTCFVERPQGLKTSSFFLLTTRNESRERCKSIAATFM